MQLHRLATGRGKFLGNDIQLYTDTRITDHFLPSSFKSFNRCTYSAIPCTTCAQNTSDDN